MSDEIKPVRPWDLFLTKERVIEEIQEKRLLICSGCENYIKLTKQCIKCGCLLIPKVKLPKASCPIGKWGQADEVDGYTLPKIVLSKPLTKNGKDFFHHLHIPKTAGIYIHNYLIIELETSFKQNKIRYSVDHAGWTHVDDTTYILSSLRNPVQRTVSHFCHMLTFSGVGVSWDNWAYASVKDIKNPTVAEFMAWVTDYKEYISNYQSKNFLYVNDGTADKGAFFINDPAFVNMKINRELVYERINKIDILLKDSQINTANINQIRNKIADDFGIKLIPNPMLINMPVSKNINPMSKTLFESLNKAQLDYLAEINDLDTELYNDDSLFWNGGK